MKWNQAIGLLGECEGLRKLVAEAVAEGEYSEVSRINDLARAVGAMTKDGKMEGEDGPALRLAALAQDRGVGAVMGTLRPSSGQGRKGKLGKEYPKFFRRGEELVKVGWSKKDRKEYNHRAPRGAVEAVVAAVKQVGGRGKLFKGDALLPLKDGANGAIPDYQAYVGLAWLKHLGLVKQHGRRGGYTLVPQKQIEVTIAATWPELAEWRG